MVGNSGGRPDLSKLALFMLRCTGCEDVWDAFKAPGKRGLPVVPIRCVAPDFSPGERVFKPAGTLGI